MGTGRRHRKDEGSDDEFNSSARQSQKDADKEIEDKPEDILAHIVQENIDFSDEKSEKVESFYTRYKETFRKSNSQTRYAISEPGNILHVLAKGRFPTDESTAYWTKVKLTQFMRSLLHRHHMLLEVRVEGDSYPLHIAFKSENHDFIQAIIEFDSLKNVGAVLRQKKKSRNYVQIAILLESPLLPAIARKCHELDLPVWNCDLNVAGKDSETPLHIAVRKVLRVQVSEKEPLSDYLLAKPGSRDYTPIAKLYQRWKRECALKQHGRDIRSFKSSSLANAIQPGVTNGTTDDTRLDNDGNSSLSSVPREYVVQLLVRLIDDYQQSRTSMSQVDIVKLLIDLSEDSLKAQSIVRTADGDVRETPYQERIAKLWYIWEDLVEALEKDKIAVVDGGLGEEDAMQMVTINDPIADTIRYHCIRHFDRDKIARCLYKPGGERHIDFDLAGLRSPSVSNAFLKRLARHLRFESILKYVALPKLELEDYIADAEEHNQDNSQQVASQRVTDLRAVFQWLRNNNVKRILKVTVVDYGSPCHSDAIIEEALKDFQVEIWDWKKVNMCTDVISNSTSMARHVSLYSSCNNAVLMGWASAEGLGDRKKFPKLEHVRLFITKGQEGDRRAKYVSEFERKIRLISIPDSGGKCVTVEHHLDDGKISFAADFKNNEISEQQEIEWINKVGGFSQFLRNIPRAERDKIRPIKIAIIDDGVDASLEFLVGQIRGGKSFCPYARSSDLMNAYYVPSGQHGTMMADLICRICPSCELYIARLDERPSRSDSSRQIMAVKWAADCRVDIISMSWTIDGTSTPANDISAFEAAIAEAKKQKILMFCSTSDHGSISSDNYWPAKSNECIRIGAATALGDRCTWVPDQYDYLLPGKHVPFKWKRQDGVTSWYETGSSLSTALAAGLAGLLLYCDRAVNREGDVRSQDSAAPRNELHTKSGMTNVFNNLALMSKDHRFLRADVWLDRKFRAYVRENEARLELASMNPNSLPYGKSASRESPNFSELQWSDECKDALRRLLDEMKSVDGA
ncbi:hypothetical protein F4861DRAFT_538412 [Xylaria intraflava]|nr:hypothetical protein F4861DRAFT_538412 [Xylaria intraflava]